MPCSKKSNSAVKCTMLAVIQSASQESRQAKLSSHTCRLTDLAGERPRHPVQPCVQRAVKSANSCSVVHEPLPQAPYREQGAA